MLLFEFAACQPDRRGTATEYAAPLQSVAEWETGLSAINGFALAADGRLLLASARDQVILRLNTGSGAVDTLGRVGDGPGEYRAPGAISRAEGDSLIMADGQSRAILLEPGGRPVRTIVYAPSILLPQFRGADSSGFIYLSRPVRDSIGSDSLIVFRWHPGEAAVVESIATVRTTTQGVLDRVSKAGSYTRRSRVNIPQPFGPAESWAPRADGSVWVVRVEPYRIERIAAGSRAEGARLTIPPVTVLPEDRERHAASGLGVEIDWPDVKAPFDASRVVFSQDVIAVPRFGRWSDSLRLYDLFDISLARVASIQLDTALVLISIDGPRFFARRSDADGLQSLIELRRSD